MIFVYLFFLCIRRIQVIYCIVLLVYLYSTVGSREQIFGAASVILTLFNEIELNSDTTTITMNTMILLNSRPCFKFNKPFVINTPPSSFQIIELKRNFKFKSDYRKSSCKAVFSDDAPFAAAIGACMLTSLVFPIPVATEEDEESAITSTDTRLAVMGIMSFIPYFNWLSWIFAWIDTGNRRYAIYSLVYLAPYIKSNLSISPEESWLPIASILFCIVHIQLEASIKNGDIQGFQLFKNVMDQQSSSTRNEGRLSRNQEMSKGSKNEKKNLPSAEEQSRDIGGWEDSQGPLEYKQRLNDSIDDDDEKRSKH
ncbi:uncharacterized protein LOC131652528 [Vicia villosa]|uniref:uncharacterized protein LOC131652528 n=1 Tax=Vicia villosa TaxID=3911 RepID=UPI00273BB34E|nr:uncharacterized protein LOC131652528 [Vicia villosa]